MEVVDLLAQAHPLAPAGGVFLGVVGATIMLGAANMRLRFVALGVGATLAIAVTVAFAVTHPMPRPSALQMAVLAAAVAFQVAAIALAGRTLEKLTERGKTLAILAIVSVHLFIMAAAFGPVIVALGTLGLGNAALGATAPRYPLSALWLADGALKLIAGAIMLCRA